MPLIKDSCLIWNPESFDEAPVPIAVTDPHNGIIMYINDSFCAILGRKKESLRGRSWERIAHPDDSSLIKNATIPHIGDARWNAYLEQRLLASNGDIVWVGLNVFNSPDATKRNFHIIIATDLSATKRKQALLDMRTHSLDKAREAVINSMAILSEFRDRETGEHIARTRLYVQLILEHFPRNLPFSRKAISQIANSAILHDIGKVGIPDHILLKQGRLTKEEFDVMKTHTTLGAHAIMRTRRVMENDAFLMFAKEIAESHHERWDGTGYPAGLAGDQIPLTARVMAIADVYDALRSERPYKAPYSHDLALQVMREGAGTQFDAELVAIFLANSDEVLRISTTEKAVLEREFEDLPEETFA
jgi:PAS domain S-box-containing protein